MKRLVFVSVSALTLVAVGCDKKEDKTAAAPDKGGATTQTTTPVANAATAAAAPASANAKPFAIDAAGKIAIDMPAPKEHIKAAAQNTSGELSIDPTNIAATKGNVKVDLTTLKTATFDAADKNVTQTEHALTWLEVGPKATPEEQARNKFVVFTVQGVSGLSATDLSKVAATKDGTDDVRTVTGKVKGEVLLHGKTSVREADVSVSFRGPADKPTRVDIKTTTPFKIVLADHDVKPRDNFGKLAQGAFHLLGTKVAEDAAINLELTAKPK